MKRSISAFTFSFLLIPSFSLFAQQDFQVKGKLVNPSLEGEKVTLSYFNGKKNIYDSARIKNGVFEFTGSVATPTKGTVSRRVQVTEQRLADWSLSEKNDFYLEEGVLFIEGTDLSASVIKGGGPSQKDYQELKTLLAPYEKKDKESNQQMVKAARVKDSAGVNTAKERTRQIKVSMDSVETAFIYSHPASFVSLALVKERVTSKALAEEKEWVSKLYNSLADPLKKTTIGKEIKSQIDIAYKLAPGKPSIDFTMNDTTGRPVSLSSFRGKYVLLDFWASWCIPCRHENKTVVKAYDRFKDRNFTVLSVALEQPGAEQAWLDAIHKDGLNWTNVSDMAFGDNAAAVAYGVRTIPMNFLIDPDGMIVAVHLRGEALLEKLEELLSSR